MGEQSGSLNSATKIVAGTLGLTAFAVAAIAGLGVGNTAEVTLFRAMLAMFICYFAGLPLGKIAEHVIQEHVAKYIAERPVKAPTTGGEEAVVGETTDAKVDEEAVVV